MAPVRMNGNALPVIAIDIGNTRIKAGLVDSGGTICGEVRSFPTGELEERLPDAIASLPEEVSREIPVVIAGVVEHAAERAKEILQRKRHTVYRLQSTLSLPVTIRYRIPGTLGADRVANALYAAAMYPDRPVVIIAAGTAIVVDYVENGTFFGGAILPGVRTQLESLHRATQALPLVDVYQSTTVPDLPASSTDECISGGVVRGCAAAVDGFIDAYTSAYGTGASPVVIATGGDWQLLRQCVSHQSTYLPELTLIGLARALPFLVAL